MSMIYGIFFLLIYTETFTSYMGGPYIVQHALILKNYEKRC